MKSMDWIDKLAIAIILIVLALAIAPKAHAGTTMVVEGQDGDKIILTENACTRFPELTTWKQGTFLYHGQRLAMCWKLQEGTVLVLDSQGDVTPVPQDAFHAETSI